METSIQVTLIVATAVPVAWEFPVLTPAQPVPPAAGVIRANCAPQVLFAAREGQGRLFDGGRKWDEAQDRFRDVGTIAAIALLIFAYNFF
jgi:hypothetical protein